MRRHLSNLLLSGLLLAGLGSPAWACLNDSEVDSAEREFKSQYQVQPTPEPTPPPSSNSDGLKTYGPLILGGALLVGAVFQGRRRARQ
jgi:hypothetical protein